MFVKELARHQCQTTVMTVLVPTCRACPYSTAQARDGKGRGASRARGRLDPETNWPPDRLFGSKGTRQTGWLFLKCDQAQTTFQNINSIIY